MPQDKLPIPQFAAKIKAKYPQYKDIDDTVLVQKILAKYPEYNEQVDMAVGVKKKEPSSVGAAASTSALAGGGQVGSSKAPSSGLVPTGTENEYDREMKRRQMEAEGVDYNPNDPLGSYLKVAQNKIASTRDRAASENTSSKVAKLSASIKNKEVIAEKNAIEKFRFNNVEEAKQFAYHKLDKSKLVLKDSNVDLTKAEGLENYTDESILQAAGDNFTVNKAVSQYLKNKKIKEELQSSSSISEAAIKNAIDKGDIQAKNIEQVGGEIPNQMKGDIILSYLNNPDVLEEVRKDPVLLEQYRKEIFDLPKNNPMAAIKIMAQMVSKRREDSGGNNGILNAPSQSSTDKYVDELVESGELPVQYKYLYERPEVKQAVKSSLKTSGFLENTFQSANESVEGISNSVAQLTGAKNLYTTEEQKVFNQLQKEYGQVAFKPKGWFHDITTNGGIVTGQVLPMMVGGSVLNAAKLVNNTRAANMIMTGLQSFGYNKDRALTELPGQSGAKQLAYATLNTGIEVALSNVFDDTKLARQLMKGVSPEVKTILTKFTNKEITSAAAKEEVNNIFLKALENAPQFVKGVVGTAEKEAREEAITEILQIANNQVFGGQPIELDQAASQAFDVWRTTFLGSLPLGIGGGIVEVNKNPEMGKMVYEMATNPEKYAEIIKNNAALDEEYGADLGQKLSNLEYITKVKQDLDSREDMNQVDKEKFLITSLNQKIVADQAAQITEPTLRKEPEKTIEKLESEKEQILSNPTPLTKEQEAIKAAVDNGTLQGMNQMMAIEAIKDPSVAKSYLEMIADQSKNEVATVEGAETQGKANIDFGEDLVKMATEMFPKREPGAEDISQPIELDPTLPEGYELPGQPQVETEVNIPELPKPSSIEELQSKKDTLEAEKQQAITEATKPVVDLELLGDEQQTIDLITKKASGDNDGGKAKIRQHERIRVRLQALKDLIDCV